MSLGEGPRAPRPDEHAGRLISVQFKRLNLEVSEYLADVLTIKPPEVEGISVELESRRSRRHDQDAVVAEDGLEIVHHGSPVPDVLEYFRADHHVEGFQGKASEQYLGWAHHIDAWPGNQVDADVVRWPQRYDDVPHPGQRIAGAHF